MRSVHLQRAARSRVAQKRTNTQLNQRPLREPFGTGILFLFFVFCFLLGHWGIRLRKQLVPAVKVTSKANMICC